MFKLLSETETELANRAAMAIDAVITSEVATKISPEDYQFFLEAEERLFAIRDRMATTNQMVA